MLVLIIITELYNDIQISQSRLTRTIFMTAAMILFPFMLIAHICAHSLRIKEPLKGKLLNHIYLSREAIMIKKQIIPIESIKYIKVVINDVRNFASHGINNQFLFVTFTKIVEYQFELQSKQELHKLLVELDALRSCGVQIELVNKFHQ